MRYDHAARQYLLPEAGALIVIAHKVWRVMEVNPVAEVDWTDSERRHVVAYKAEYRARHHPAHIVLRPVEVTSTDVRARNLDKHYRVQAKSGYEWHVYRDEHYPLCNKCGEPTPCRERNAASEAQHAIEKMSRYEDPNQCPQCREPFTRRQKTHTFTENIKIPVVGAAVTFHLRGECGWAAAQYEKELIKAHPERIPELYCPGWVTNHNDGTYECTAGDRCAGPTVGHEGLHSCSCEPCNANGTFDCHPMAWATRRTA